MNVEEIHIMNFLVQVLMRHNDRCGRHRGLAGTKRGDILRSDKSKLAKCTEMIRGKGP